MIRTAANQIFCSLPAFLKNQKATHLRSLSPNKDLPGKPLALLSRNVLTASPSLSWTRAVDSDKGIPKLKRRIRPESAQGRRAALAEPGVGARPMRGRIRGDQSERRV